MSSNLENEDSPLLGQPESIRPKTRHIITTIAAILAGLSIVAAAAVGMYLLVNSKLSGNDVDTYTDFFSSYASPEPFCGEIERQHTGYIGLKGDSHESPRRSFHWFMEAQQDAENRPLILTMGGGPGTTGLVHVLDGLGPCMINSNGTVDPNPYRWTDIYNVVFLDHPIGTGFSHGPVLQNNSRAAAFDVYDFLQKFYRLHPKLANNPLHLLGGSYGGLYVPHIAKVIVDENKSIRNNRGIPGAQLLPLESLMISNPISDYLTHMTYAPEFICKEHHILNQTDCDDIYTVHMPNCSIAVQKAYAYPTLENKWDAMEACDALQGQVEANGYAREDIRRRCTGDSPLDCLPGGFVNLGRWLNRTDVKTAIGVEPDYNFTVLSLATNAAFLETRDIVQSVLPFFPQFLEAGIRVLHHEGMQDANCAWPAVLHTLEQWEAPEATEFRQLKDIPWKGEEDEATVRVVGEGAGIMTYVQVKNAGHFIIYDAPRIERKLAEYWIENRPFV